MPYNATVYKIMIASPSDVVDERELITDLIYKWNNLHSQEEGIVILPIKWEADAVPQMGDRGQEIINKQFDSSDILIGVFWTRIGTRTIVADSGTVEEIETFKNKGKPVLIYFSSKAISPERIDQEQYKKLEL